MGTSRAALGELQLHSLTFCRQTASPDGSVQLVLMVVYS